MSYFRVFTLLLLVGLVTLSQAVAQEGPALFQEDFSDNSAAWWTAEGDYYTAQIIDEQFVIELETDQSSRVLTVAGENNWSLAPDFVVDYEASMDVRIEDSGEDVGYFQFIFDVQDEYESFSYWTLPETQFYNFGDTISGPNGADAGNYQTPVDLFDGEVHRLSFRVTRAGAELRADGVLLASENARSVPGGSIGFGAALWGSNQPQRIRIEIDNIVVRAIPQEEAEPAFVDIVQAVPDTDNPLLIDDFSTSNTRWTFDDYDPSTKSTSIVDGVLRANVTGTRFDRSTFVFPRNDLTQPVQIEFDFRMPQYSRSSGAAYLEIGYNTNYIQSNVGGVFQTVYVRLTDDGRWAWYSNGDVAVDPKGWMRTMQTTNLFDGDWHRVVFNIQMTALGQMVTLTVDGDMIINDVWDVTFLEAYLPYAVLWENVNGGWALHFGSLPGNNGDGPSFNFEIDNLAIYPLADAQVAAGTGLGEADTVVDTPISRLRLYSPSGWILAPTEAPDDLNKSNEQVYNPVLFNNPQGVSAGGDNQVGITLYDPAQVIEGSQIADTRATSLEEVLSAFTGRSSIETDSFNDKEIAITSNGQREFWIATRSSDDSVVVLGIELGLAEQFDEFAPTLYSIATELDYPLPPQGTGPGLAVENLVRAVYDTDEALMLTAVCPADAVGFLALLGAVDAATDLAGGQSDDSAPLPRRAVSSVDTSGVYSEVVKSERGVAFVRLMGIVHVFYADGGDEVISFERAVGPFISRYGQNGYRVINTSSGWQVCGGVFG